MGSQSSSQRNSEELLNKKIAVLRANSNLSEKDIREIYSDFKKECPSGRLNKAQFQKYYKKLADADDQDGHMSDLAFHAFDTNRDGSIDMDEFVMAYGVQSSKDIDAQLDLVFDMLDASGDGRVSYSEMVNFMDIALKLAGDKGKNMSGRKAASEVFEAFGVSESDKLSRRQFVEGCKKSRELREVFAFS